MEVGSRKELVCLIVSGCKCDVIGGGLKKTHKIIEFSKLTKKQINQTES